jgi:hypothetical protein
MKTKSGWVLGLLTVSGTALVGCGGGGTSASSSPTLATKTRLLQAGDQWVYNVTGQGQDGTATVTATGTVTDTVSSKPFNGGTALARETVSHIKISNGRTIDIDNTLYFSQDSATGDIIELGEQDNISNPTAPDIATPPGKVEFGNWSAGETLTPSISLNNAAADTRPTQTISGSETVQTPAGNFAAWKVTIPPSGNLTFTQDWAPQLGAPVRFAGTLYGYGPNSTGGITTINATALLQSTTVPH